MLEILYFEYKFTCNLSLNTMPLSLFFDHTKHACILSCKLAVHFYSGDNRRLQMTMNGLISGFCPFPISEADVFHLLLKKFIFCYKSNTQ